MLVEVISFIYFGIILISLYFFSQIDQGRNIPPDLTLPELPMVSIIVPARNEEKNIRNCLNSLLKLDYPSFEIIVVEGNSDDTTHQIVETEFPTVKLIQEPPRPANWAGKIWACHIGSQNARGQVFLFSDADTIHSPNTLKKLVPVLLNETDGFLSIVTKQRLEKLWEYTLVIIFQFVALSLLGMKGSKNRHLANGQFMMFTRETYERLSGHQSVSSAIIEDMELASLAAANGIRPIIYDTPELVEVKMYNSFSELVEGFSKNLAVGAKTLSSGAFLRVNFVQAWANGWLILLILGFFLKEEIMLLWIASAFGYITYALVCLFGEFQLARKITVHMFFFPIYMAIYQYILLKSFYLVYVQKAVKWKGISYRLTT